MYLGSDYNLHLLLILINKYTFKGEALVLIFHFDEPRVKDSQAMKELTDILLFFDKL